MNFKSEYDIGDRVYLRARDEKVAGLITAIRFSGEVKLCAYMISWGDTTETVHYELELTREYLKSFDGD